MRPPADPAVAFGPAHEIGMSGPAVAPACFRGQQLRGEFLADSAVRSDCGRYVVLSQFRPSKRTQRWRTGAAAGFVLVFAVAIGTDKWPWLDAVAGGLAVAAAVLLAGVTVGGAFLSLLAPLTGAGRFGGPFRLLLLDEHTGQCWVQRGGDEVIVPLELNRAGRLRYQPALADWAPRTVKVGTATFRKRRPEQVFAAAELLA
ncbi:hypothetical protein [Hymenobacter jeollabukensis]|uniref:Uncharacterized protein n=1 Tax=Hymenobacter jeollabukensis TaxID=2025313 RepID=A0A5R8WP61_9BACT|nr:hypothetical protein [Hymenobacter jeollabukensis]TLM91233.1 hypothetical protein FDY95_16720 [Hymenobacter jeollabukensis]